MSTFRVERSALRQFMFGLAGLLLILAAIDIVWAHKIAEPPTMDSNGTLTTRGQVDRRHDLMWGSLFLLVGGGTVLVAVSGLVRRQPMLEIDESGVSIRLVSGNQMMHVPFHRIIWARSSVDNTPGAGINPRQLLIAVDDPARFPEHLWGAEWEDDVLRVDVQGWTETAEEMAIRIGIEKTRYEVKQAAAAQSAAESEEE
ncbi:MAG: hypothetical protein HKN91_09810, partial [Acidimicrobiia bacterium]|nr:hypothetical protein [Acidimicrobiia bacterium]